ncbi:MAG: hypothetical protein AAGN66_01570 [Acidobacteriota bacterium]
MGLRGWLGSKPEENAEPDGADAVAEARHRRQRGDMDTAWGLLMREVERHPDNPEAVQELWDLAQQIDRLGDAAVPFLRRISKELRGDDASLAVFHWFELVDRLGEAPEIDLEARVRLAEEMVRADHGESASELLEPTPEQLDPHQPLALRLRLAMAAAASRSPAVEAVAAHVLGQPGLPEGHRQQLQGALQGARAAGLRPPATGTDDGPIELSTTSVSARRLKVIPAVPRAVDAAALAIEIQGQGRRRLAVANVQTLAAGMIDDGSGAPYVVIDLLVDSLWAEREEIRTVRFRTCDFDPGALVPEAADPQIALGTFLETLLATSQAQPLPVPEAVVGRPFQGFASVAEYESRVLELRS